MAGIYLKVTRDFIPSSSLSRFRDKEPEISVEKGDIIFDVKKLEDGWVFGKNLNTGKAGVFPASCTAKLSGSDDSDTGSETSVKAGKNKTAKDPVEDVKKPFRRSSSSSQGSSGKQDPIVNGNDQPKTTGTTNGATKKPGEYNKSETPNSSTSQPATSSGANLFRKQLSKTNINPASGKDKEKSPETSQAKDSANYSTVNKPAPLDSSIRDTPARAQLFKLRPVGSREERMKENKRKEQERRAKEEKEKEKKEKERKDREQKEKEQKEKEERERLEKERKEKEKKLKEEREKQQKAKEKLEDRQKVKVDGKPETDKIAEKSEDELYLNDSPFKKPKLARGEEELESEKPDPHYLNDEPTAASTNHQNQSSTATPCQTEINIQANPLTKDDENIYQTPELGKLPEKPQGGCDECHEPHDYDVPNHYKTPPGSPVRSKKKKDKSKKKKEKIKLNDMEDKLSDPKFANQRNKMASYESIRADFAKSSTESVKDAVKAVKETKEHLTTRRFPRLRIIGGITIGFVLGIICFLILYLVIFIPVVSAAVAGFVIGLVAAITFGFLNRTRILCIVLLIFPSLFSTGGKIAMWILITYFVITGPICNIAGNIHVIASSRSCVALTSNESLANTSGQNLLFSRLNSLENQVQEYEKTIRELGTVVSETLLNMNLANINQTASLNNYTEQQCSSSVDASQLVCLTGASSAFDTCTKIFQGSGKEIQLRKKCQIFKASNMCSVFSDRRIQQMCSNINLTLAKIALIETKQIIESKRDLMIQNTATAQDMRGYDSILYPKWEVCGFTEILTMLLPLLILLVLYEAFRYHKLFMSRNCFDNHYLTTHFKSIDELRKSSGTSDGLLPLKKGELKKYVRPSACQLAVAERNNLCKFLFIYFIYLLFALIFILFDYFFYRAIADEWETSPADASGNETASTSVSGYPEECSLKLTPPSQWYVIVLPVLLGGLLLMIFLQAHVLRLRRFVTRRFYPRRERKRVAYLYYKILEDRRSFVKAVIGRINSKVDENEMLKELDVAMVLANHFQTMDWLFTTLHLGTKSCMVCGTGLNKKYIFCESESCEAVYCRTCFWDLENKCLGCMCGSKAASVLSSDSFRRNNSVV